MKKKVLFLSQVFPYPGDGGGKIKTLHTLLTLSQKYEVHAVFISEKNPSDNEREYLLQNGVSSVTVFYNENILASVKDNIGVLFQNFILFRPHYVFQYTLPVAKEKISEIIHTLKPEIIHVDHVNIAQYLPSKKTQIWILEHHNVEFYLLWTRFIHSSKLSRKIYLLIECVFTYLFELLTLRKFNHIFAISEVDEQRVRRFFGVHRVTTQRLVYPFVKILPTVKRPNILFIGNLRWPPNEDAAEWFISKVFPLIKKRIPEATLHLVGSNYPLVFSKYQNRIGVFFHEYQKSIEPFLKRATVFVLPFRMGGGVRIKSLTAMSYAVPIVSTAVGVEGLTVKDGKEFLSANTATSFAQQCIRLLSRVKLREAMKKNQQKYMENNHSFLQDKLFLETYEKVSKLGESASLEFGMQCVPL